LDPQHLREHSGELKEAEDVPEESNKEETPGRHLPTRDSVHEYLQEISGPPFLFRLNYRQDIRV